MVRLKLTFEIELLYQNILSGYTKLLNSLLELTEEFLLSSDVHLTVDAVDFRVESEEDAVYTQEMLGEIWLTDHVDSFNAALNHKLNRRGFLSEK